MKRVLSLFVSAALCVALFPISAPPALAGVPPQTSQYLQYQSRADAWNVMALRSAGVYVQADELTADGQQTATDIERTILGVIAGGANPYSFRGVDLLAYLDKFRSGAQMGDWELLNDDIFGILAYWSAGYAPGDNRIAESRQHLLNNQNTDGGWGYRRGAVSDSNITAMAVVALIRTGSLPNDPAVARALSYIKGLQNPDGGFPSGAGYGSDAASTAWVIYAMRASGIDIATWAYRGRNAYDFLNSVANGDGSYRWQVTSSGGSPLMTAYVALALSGGQFPVATYPKPVASPTYGAMPSPVAPVAEPTPIAQPAPAPAPIPVAKPAPALPPTPVQPAPQPVFAPTPAAQKPGVHFRIEGATEQVCQGWVSAWTAIDVVREAASQCGYSYQIEQSSFGQYLTQINNDRAGGANGWLYRVNWKQPNIGAQEYYLTQGEYVTWYFGEFDWTNIKARIVNVQPLPTGARVYVLVEQDRAGYFAPAPHASVWVNGLWYQAGADGMASFTVGYGWFSAQASATDAVRSHKSWKQI